MANGPSVDRVGIEVALKRAEEVRSKLSRLQAIAREVEARANRSESRVLAGARQIGVSAFTTVGNQLIAFAAGEVIGNMVNQQTDSKLFGFLSQVGASTAAGFAFGGPVGGITAAVTGTISGLITLAKERAAEIEAIKQELKDRKRREDELDQKLIKALEDMEIRFEQRLEKIEESSRKAAEDLAYMSYQYL